MLSNSCRRTHRASRGLAGGVRSERGQALFETGLVVLIFVGLLLALVEFGRAFMLSNVVTNAARVGARLAAIAPGAQRDPNGVILSGYVTTLEDTVEAEIAALDPVLASAATVLVTQDAGPPPTVEVRVTGSFDALFNYLGTSSFPVDRSVTFPDQGRDG